MARQDSRSSGHFETDMSQDSQRRFGWGFWLSLVTAGFLFYGFAISGGFSIRPSDFAETNWNLHNIAVLILGLLMFCVFVICCVYCIRCVLR